VNKLSKLKAISSNNNISNTSSNLGELTDSINMSNSKLNKYNTNIIENSTGT